MFKTKLFTSMMLLDNDKNNDAKLELVINNWLEDNKHVEPISISYCAVTGDFYSSAILLYKANEM